MYQVAVAKFILIKMKLTFEKVTSKFSGGIPIHTYETNLKKYSLIKGIYINILFPSLPTIGYGNYHFENILEV